jgi:CRP-like cAMP-binding protein
MRHFLGGRSVTLVDDERRRLEQLVASVRRFPSRTTLVDRNAALVTSTMLVEGFMVRFIADNEGERQVVAFHVPGDFVDLHGFPLERLDHSIATLTEVEVALVPHAALEGLLFEARDLSRKLWFATLLDAAMHREWLFRLGRLEGVGRVAHFLAETDARLRPIGLSDGRRFALPISQSDLAEIVGLTSIHVNRVLRTLREDGVAVFRQGQVDILDPDRLTQLGQFEGTYLYLTQDAAPGPEFVGRNSRDE